MNIYDLWMNGFSTETAVCLQALHYSVLTGIDNAYYAQMINTITCSEVIAKSSAFLDSILVYSGQMSSGTAKNFLFLGTCTVTALRAEKTYLVIQTWRIVKWFRYPCYDGGCYP